MSDVIQLRVGTAAAATSANDTLLRDSGGAEIGLTDDRTAHIGHVRGWVADGASFTTLQTAAPRGIWATPGDLAADIANLVTGQASSVDGEVALYSSTGGKSIKRSTLTGVAKQTSGVQSATPATINDLGSQTADYSANSHKITSVTDGSSSGDAVNKGQLDLKAPLASPTFTGTVTLPTGLTGLAKLASGVVSAATAMTDYQSPVITVARSTNSTAKNADATAANDTQLFITLPSAGTYWVWAFLLVTSATNADIRVGWDLSAFTAPTFDWVGMQDAALAMTMAAQSGGTATIIGTLGAVTTSIAMPQGYLTVAAGGVLTLQWAQGTSQASNTTVLARSRLSAQRVA